MGPAERGKGSDRSRMHVYRVQFSDSDGTHLAGRACPPSVMNGVDFSRVVVEKPWGYEYLLYATPFSHVWSLYLRHNEITSMHCHPRKKTGLMVLEGKALFSTLRTAIELRTCDAVVLDPGVFHSTRALSKEGLRVLEFETPPHKYDLIRLKDRYGRERKRYEGRNRMKPGRADLPRLPEGLAEGIWEGRYFRRQLGLRRVRGRYAAGDTRLLQKYDAAVVLEGTVYSRDGAILHTVGDIVRCEDFGRNLRSHVVPGVTLLLVKGSGG